MFHWQIPCMGGLTAAALISQLRPIWRDRYLTAFTPLLIVNYVMVCDRMMKRFPSWLSTVLPVALWFVTWLPQLQFFHDYPQSSAWILAEKVGRLTDPKKDLVVISFETMAPMINRYLPKDVESITFPDLERVNIFRWAGVNTRIRDNTRFEKLLARMKQVLDSGGNIWLVENIHTYLPLEANYPLARQTFNAIEGIRMCQIRYWLLHNAAKDIGDPWAPGREFMVMASHFRPRNK